MVRYRYLHTDHRWNQDDIALYTSGQGGRRVTIGTGQSVHGHALFGQGASFCDQIFHTAGYAIGSQKSDYRGNTIFEEYQQASPLFEEGVYGAINLEQCVRGRKVFGGPAPEAVEEQIRRAEDALAKITE